MNTNLDRLGILKILNLKGSMTYSDLQSLAGFKTERESGKFAYHLKKLVEQSFVTRDSERVCAITNLGKIFLHTAKKSKP